MFFYYFDSQAQLHQSVLTGATEPILDIDVHWLTLGHKVYPQRLHGMACFEKIASEIPEEHQFTYRAWYDSQTRSTHCIWYSIPKWIIHRIPEHSIHARSLPFVIQRFFPPSLRNKSILCFIEMSHCETVIGFVRGQAVCFKKLPPHTQVNVPQEWQYVQQAYPQWHFDHSLFFTSKRGAAEHPVQTHQNTIHIEESASLLNNRMKLYGFG